MTTADASSSSSIGKPCTAYDTMTPLWKRSRAICSGERAVKKLDEYIDKNGFSNMLLPFSPTMTQAQYTFYLSEAELPGIVAQYARMLVGGLLRKPPKLVLPEGIPEEAKDWILNNFDRDGSPLISFLDSALWEEIQTNRSWIFIDYPDIPEGAYTQEELLAFKPYPVFWSAESIINWRTSTDPATGEKFLSKIVVRVLEEEPGAGEDGDLHPVLKDTIYIHDVSNGTYRVRKFREEEKTEESNGNTTNGRRTTDTTAKSFVLVKTSESIEAHGEVLTRIPAWPLNGSITPMEPLLMPMINREVGLYNKVSRRNHLLYGAATYTPYIKSNMEEADFNKIVNAGLGSWLQIGQEDDIGVLKPPTESLKDMESAIAASLEEMARMGLRMLAPETSQSGVALELRNAAQTAQLGSLNTRVSNVMGEIIAFMIYWRYGVEVPSQEIEFELSEDFNPMPIGADWLRLVTEWYESGLIPRSVWLSIIRQNDLIPPDYDDEKGIKEINSADNIVESHGDQVDKEIEDEIPEVDK